MENNPEDANDEAIDRLFKAVNCRQYARGLIGAIAVNSKDSNLGKTTPERGGNCANNLFDEFVLISSKKMVQ